MPQCSKKAEKSAKFREEVVFITSKAKINAFFKIKIIFFTKT